VVAIAAAGSLIPLRAVPVAASGPAFVRSFAATETNASTALSVSPSTATGTGDLLVATIGVRDTAANLVLSVSDSASNTWVNAGAANDSTHTTNGEIWFVANAASIATSGQITVTIGNSSTIAFRVQEFSGMGAYPAVREQRSGATGVSTSPWSKATPTTLAASEVAVGVIGAVGESAQSITVTGTGWTAQGEDFSNVGTSAGYHERSAYKIVSLGTTPSMAGTLARSGSWSSAIVTFESTGNMRALKGGEIDGLLDRQGVPQNYTNMDAYVLNAYSRPQVDINWSDLEPTQGTFDTTLLDAALSTVPAGDEVKIRVMAGVFAPTWAQNLDGSNTAVSGTWGTVGRWWENNFRIQWDALLSYLGDHYDSTATTYGSKIEDFTISRCMTLGAEPLLRQAATLSNDTSLHAAGFTDAADKACHSQDIADYSAYFPTTHVSFSFNPYEDVDATYLSGHYTTDITYTDGLLSSGRAIAGKQLVLENNSIRCDVGHESNCGASQNSDYSTMYTAIFNAGAPIAFQTATCTTFSDSAHMKDALQWAINGGANAVELPHDYDTTGSTCYLTQTEVGTYDTSLESNTNPTTR
jgi:hypothetical protein